MKINTIICLSVLLGVSAVWGGSDIYDVSVGDFPRQAGETGDSARIMRAVTAAGKGGVVWFPRGEYAIDEMLVVSNQTSLLLHKSASLKAVREMPYVMRYFGGQLEKGVLADHNLFIKGGQFDGNGLAGCANVMGLKHFTMADTTYRNGKRVGLQLGDPSLPRSTEGGYEIVCNNLYFVCNLSGLAGNVGFLTYIGDSHFTDIVVVDYTISIRDCKWSNRYTRCHVWGGPVKKAGTNIPEMLENSIAFDLQGDDCVLEDCYADTAMIGYNVCKDARIFNCAYFNNWVFKMDNPTVFRHQKGSLIVSGCRFSKNSPNATLYSRGKDAGRLFWRDNQPFNFNAADMKELNDELKKCGEADTAAKNETKLAG